MNTSTMVFDLENAFSWESIYRTFDENDVLQSRYIVYDNGTTRDEQYEDGALRYLVQSDVGPSGEVSDVKNWTRIETTYDSNGNIEDRFELKDDGTTLLRSYEFGTIRQVVRTDIDEYGEQSDVKNWERIEVNYNENGQKESRFELRDDGVTIVSAYENGTLRSITQEDLGEYGEPSDARNWARIETTYNETGQIESRFELKDNGVTIVNQYNEDVLVFQIQTDEDDMGQSTDVKPWETISTLYDDNGDLFVRETVFDNTDVTALFYEDGVRSARLQLDGDDSASWFIRETLYDAGGQVEAVNEYDSFGDLPPQYGFLDPA